LDYKAVIFDLGRVLVDFDFKRGYRQLEGLCPYAAADIPKRLAGTGLVDSLETGRIEPRKFVSEISTVLSLNADYDRFCEIWSCIFTDTLVPETMLEGLKRRYRLVLMSNTNAIHFEMLRDHYPRIWPHFDSLVLSYEVGAMKPRPEIYRTAIERAGCPPEECFYTDDIAEYVEAGRRLGIDAVQFRSVGQLERELKNRGILWE
jgi:putative hydrolase of the HAD superfamily